MIYYEDSREPKHRSIAIIPDSLAHGTVAVHESQKIVINYLKNNFEPKKIDYFTDGAGQHFKNKSSFANLQAHEEDFDIPAEWHFYGTAHGKGARDGTGANMKRSAAPSNLQRSSKHHILTPQASLQWAKSNCKETEIFFSSKESYAIATEILKRRFDQAVTISSRLQYHAFISTHDRKLLMKKFSSSEKYDIFPKGQKKKPQKRTAKLPPEAKKIAKKHNSTK